MCCYKYNAGKPVELVDWLQSYLGIISFGHQNYYNKYFGVNINNDYMDKIIFKGKRKPPEKSNFWTKLIGTVELFYNGN